MDLSIVIVNYNVRYFLEQCLISVQNSVKSLNCEVFVVDNNSIDGSVELVKEKFPWVKLIESKENLGFSKGNNLAIKQASGKYILLLNPDTVLQEDTLEKTVRFMNEHDDAGGLGIKMINGKGEFLPESKRGLPTPQVAFYKIFGLSKLFPKSEKFGAYHLTYLDRDKNHKVDVLSGAFMMLRKSVLNKIGLLDETFFMYGEDIDLSYRITKAGYNNYYFADSTIIHYKGESTKKSSINYVVVFYKAMQIFAQKHFISNDAKLFAFLINLAIYLRAGLSISKRIIQSLTLPVIDYMGIATGLFVIKHYYQQYSEIEYNEDLTLYGLLTYSFIWIVSIFFTGGYDKPIKLKYSVKGTIYGLIAILTLYSLLSEEYRFSRAIILIGGIYTAIITSIIRIILNSLKIESFKLARSIKKRIAIVSSTDEFNRIKELTNDLPYQIALLHHIKTSNQKEITLADIDEAINVLNVNEIIFSGNDNSTHQIINNMCELSQKDISFKIVPKLQTFIIGSDSIDTTGDIYNALNTSNINSRKHIRDKRVLDISLSGILILAYPLIFLFYNNKLQLLKNIFDVFIGNKSFVGYSNSKLNPLLPKIKTGILPPPTFKQKDDLNNEEINLNYARNYSINNDLMHIFTHITQIDSAV